MSSKRDVWVVWTLSTLFKSPFANHLVFKGGTSLSKVYNAIQRFSEDIDITYDIRAIAPDLVKDAGDDPVPKSKSQGSKWSEEIRKRRLPKWLVEAVVPHLRDALAAQQLEAKVHAERENVYLEYPTSNSGYRYIAPVVRIEFGARSTGEPAEERSISCDAAAHLLALSFPTAALRVMRVERTIWEKLTAIHVFCLQGNIQGRLARHWYDVAKLEALGHVTPALTVKEIADRVARHKSWFFAMKDSSGRPIDYEAAVTGQLVLVPEEKTMESLATDYAKMIEEGLFIGEPETFSWVIDRCREVQTKANSPRA